MEQVVTFLLLPLKFCELYGNAVFYNSFILELFDFSLIRISQLNALLNCAYFSVYGTKNVVNSGLSLVIRHSSIFFI